MTTHTLKLDSRWFDAVANGAKPFEVCRDDRGYAIGDTLTLIETADGSETGRTAERVVTFILRAEDFPEGLKEGYAVLGVTPVSGAGMGGRITAGQEARVAPMTLRDESVRVTCRVVDGIMLLYAKSKDGTVSQRIVLMPEEMDRLVRDYRRRRDA